MEDDNAAVLDKLVIELGPYGKFHAIQFILLSLPMIVSGYYSGLYVFETLDIDYRCAITECKSSTNASFITAAVPWIDGKQSKCTRYAKTDVLLDQCIKFDNTTETCTSYIYSNETDSAVKDFNLACQDWKRTLVGSAVSIGSFISLPLYGFESDKYGRKNALAISGLVVSILGFMKSFSVCYEMFIIMQFLGSALGGGVYSSAFVLAIELVDSKNRILVNTYLNVLYSIGSMVLPLLAWWLNDWRLLVQITSVPTILIFSYIWILSESYRWLLTKKKNVEVIAVLKYAANMNKIKLSEKLLSSLATQQSLPIDNTEKNKETKINALLETIKSKVLLLRLVICSYLWITCTFVYYGLQINSVSLAGNLYINYLLTAFIEIPAGILANFTVNKFGRKLNILISFLLSGATCIGMTFLKSGATTWPLVLYLIGKFCITISFNTVYIYTSELFPTNYRQSLLAVCSTVGRIGSTTAPLTPLLALYYESLPSLFFGGLAFVAGLLMLLLPETSNIALPNTVKEAENISQIKSTRV